VAAGSMTSVPLFLCGLLRIPERSDATAARLPRWPWILAPIFGVGLWSENFGYPLSADIPWSPMSWALACTTLLVAGTTAYRRADARGRRQLRWVVYAGYVTWVPIIALASMFLLFRFAIPAWIFYLLLLTWLTFPICILIAIQRYNLLDI